MQPNYLQFEAEDFMTDEAFIHWVKTGDATASRFWSNFISEYPSQVSHIWQARATLQALQFEAPPLSEDFFATLKQDIDQTIALNDASNPKQIVPVKKMATWLRVAAAITGLLIGGALLYLYLQPSATATITIATAYQQTKTLELPDHSMVTLNANSAITYPQKWSNNRREVSLKGEAFFKIQHIDQSNGAAPFTVQSGAVQVQVLGTEFNVKTRQQTTEVMLQTGKVQLQAESNSRLMQPGQLATYNTSTRQLQTRNVDPALYTAWITHRYLFANVSLADVCHHLEDYYGLHFRIEGESLQAKKISGTLLLNNEKELLQVLSSLLNAKVQQQGRQVTIASK